MRARSRPRRFSKVWDHPANKRKALFLSSWNCSIARVGEGETDFKILSAKPIKGKDVSRRVVASICVAVLAEDDVFVSMHDFYAPMAAIGGQQRFGRCLAIRKTGNQIDDFRLGLLPLAVLLALPKARDAADVFHARPIVLDAGGVCWKHVDRTPFDAPMCLLDNALKRDEGEKPAR